MNEAYQKLKEESGRVLAEHFALYPLMTPQDAVKLLYQSEFGCGHFAPEPERALAFIRQESAALTADASHRRKDSLGGGFIRAHLAPIAGNEAELERLAEAFVRSAALKCGSAKGFSERLDALFEITRCGKAPFSEAELAGFMNEYDALGRPAVHHSETFRRNYSPAYRVVLKEHY